MDARPNPRLTLSQGERSAELAAGGDLASSAFGEACETTIDARAAYGRLRLGKCPESEFVRDGQFVSRRHAYIERRRDDFYLVDTSTNGTFVQTEDRQVHYVHRGAVRLWGAGWIALGEPLHASDPILFQEELS